MLPDFKELLKSFNAHGVKYLIVGGYAVSFHAQPRATKDLDIFIKADAENAKTVYAALHHFGAPLQDITISDLADASSYSASAVSQLRWIFFQRLMAWISTPHGNTGYRELSILRRVLRLFSSPQRI